MLSAAEIIREAERLSVENRALIVDALIRTMTRPDPEIERKLIEIAERRVEELRAGKVKPIPAEVVFGKAMKLSPLGPHSDTRNNQAKRRKHCSHHP